MALQVMVEVRGGKAVKLVIKGEAVLPAVDIQEKQLDFGEVYTGVTARIPITIVNTTPVLAGTPPPLLLLCLLTLLLSCCCCCCWRCCCVLHLLQLLPLHFLFAEVALLLLLLLLLKLLPQSSC